MTTLYYATRVDKNGNKLTSSYTNAKMREKYGGEDAVHKEDIIRAEIKDGEIEWQDRKGSGLVVRGVLHNCQPPSDAVQRFVLWGKRNNRWQETPFSFEQYGTANSNMKALIGQYQSMVIVDYAGEEDADVPGRSSELYDDGTPF